MSATRPMVALDGCRVWRPTFPTAPIEIVRADHRMREFPIRTTETLGVCLKSGASHVVRADGRSLRYPADALCIRPPGCVWSSEPAIAGFLAIDLSASWLQPHAVVGTMVFGAPRHAPDLRTLVQRVKRATSALEIDVVLAAFVAAIVDAGALQSPLVRDDRGAARGARRAREFLAAHASDNPTLETVARHAGMNKFVLLRWFRRLFGVTPHAYLMTVRIDQARDLLAAGMTSAETGAITGFADQPHFSRWFKRLMGVTPAAYARQTRRARRSITFKTPAGMRR